MIGVLAFHSNLDAIMMTEKVPGLSIEVNDGFSRLSDRGGFEFVVSARRCFSMAIASRR